MKKQWIVTWLCAVGLTFAGAGLRAQQTTSTGTVSATELKTEEGNSYNFSDADIAVTLNTLARRAGVNLIVGDNIIGKVNVHLENISPKDAMRLIAESKGYVFQEDKNVIRIRTKDEAENLPLEVRVFTLKYGKAEDIQKVLKDILGKTGKVQVDPRSNALVLSDTAPNLEKITTVLDALDSQTPQVMIEAKFIETTKNPKKELGINWGNTLSAHEINVGGQSATYPTPPLTGPYVLGQSGMVGSWLGSLGAPSTAVLDVGQLKIALSFLNTDKDNELLANPRVVTTDNGKAKVTITKQQPIPQFSFSEQTASFQLNGFQYKDIGIILNVTPRINKDNFITLEVNPEVSTSTESVTFKTSTLLQGVDIPVVETRQITTTVIIKSGNTLAMSGLIREDNSETYTKVPLMGDLPLFGPLFRSKLLEKKKRNLLVFLTPTVIKPEAENPTGFEKHLKGFPPEEVYTNDKWMPKDNAKPRNRIKNSKAGDEKPVATPTKAPTTNFGPK